MQKLANESDSDFTSVSKRSSSIASQPKLQPLEKAAAPIVNRSRSLSDSTSTKLEFGTIPSTSLSVQLAAPWSETFSNSPQKESRVIESASLLLPSEMLICGNKASCAPVENFVESASISTISMAQARPVSNMRFG